MTVGSIKAEVHFRSRGGLEFVLQLEERRGGGNRSKGRFSALHASETSCIPTPASIRFHDASDPNRMPRGRQSSRCSFPRAATRVSTVATLGQWFAPWIDA